MEYISYSLAAQRLALHLQANLSLTSILPEKKKTEINQFFAATWPVRCKRVLGLLLFLLNRCLVLLIPS
jgi:hypothetical protein